MKSKIIRQYLFSVLAIILISSLTLNILLYSQFRKYYTLLYAMELDPLGLSAYQDVSDAVKPDENLQAVVFFGDSRAAQWPNPTLDGFWFVNSGIGNQTSAQIANRFEEHVVPLQPDIMVLQIGMNDLKTIPLFPERKQAIIANCKVNIEKVVQKSLDLNATVIIATIFPTGKVPLARKLVWSKDIDNAVLEVNEFIRNLDGGKVLVLDSARILSDDHGKMRQEYSLDELHLNQAGYQVLNLELVNLLLTIEQASN